MTTTQISARSNNKYHRGLMRELGFIVLATAMATAAAYAATKYTGIVFLLAMTMGVIAGVFVIGILVRCVSLLLGRGISLLWFQKAALVVVGTMAVTIAAEGFFKWQERGVRQQVNLPAGPVQRDSGPKRLAFVERDGLPMSSEAVQNIVRRSKALTLPAEWELRKAEVPGAYHAEYWHGVLQMYDQNLFRRVEPFPPRQEGKCRIMAVGDSMTYGYGVDEKFIYSTILENVLGKEFNVEVLNLGKNGWESEDILGVIREFAPKLQPDLVVYGANHNDFLPSQIGQYTTRGFEVPIPDDWTAFLSSRSRFFRFMSDGYDALLRSAGLRADFFDDILKDFDGYQQRFRRDVALMNKVVTDQGLPPVITMVLDQFPSHGGRGYQITKVAERDMRRAGMQVVETERYYKRYNGEAFRVSLWEGHADEQGHAIFAAMIASELKHHPVMRRSRKAVFTSSK